MLLVDEVIRQFSRNSISRISQSDRFVNTGIMGITSALQKSEKIYFAPSTMLMLQEKLQHAEEVFQEVLEATRDQTLASVQERAEAYYGGWIEFHKPIKVGASMISALFYFSPGKYLETGKDGIQLYLVEQTGSIADVFYRRHPGDAWEYVREYHRCPTKECTSEYGIPLLCETCKYILVVWSQIFALSAIIAGQYLAAHRYEEKEYTGTRREKREHSNKERRVPTKHIFKVIDANEIIVLVPAQRSIQPGEKRGTWLTGDEEYIPIRTRPFTRTYRSERYINVRGQTVAFEKGVERMQPIKRENIGKHVTKVRASLYEERENT